MARAPAPIPYGSGGPVVSQRKEALRAALRECVSYFHKMGMEDGDSGYPYLVQANEALGETAGEDG